MEKEIFARIEILKDTPNRITLTYYLLEGNISVILRGVSFKISMRLKNSFSKTLSSLFLLLLIKYNIISWQSPAISIAKTAWLCDFSTDGMSDFGMFFCIFYKNGVLFRNFPIFFCTKKYCHRLQQYHFYISPQQERLQDMYLRKHHNRYKHQRQ